MNKEEIRQFKSLLKQGSLRHMNIILDDKFQKSLLEIIKDYEKKDQQITQLTNNWNELEEFVKERIQYWEEQEKEWIKQGFMKFGGEANNKIILQGLLDKMKEIKDGNNEK